MDRATKIQVISEDILIKDPVEYAGELQEIKEDVSRWPDKTLDMEVFKLFEVSSNL